MATSWKISIETAIYMFPVFAFLMTLPFMIHQYRKYGSIPVMRFLCIYLFAFYMTCAYFLVIFPMPPLEEVRNMTTPSVNLKLFGNIPELLQVEDFAPHSFHDILQFFRHWKGLEPLCNILLTLPFGFFLRYYFKKGLPKTILCSFLLSLFFELTQLSGLYGIYPRPYRIFDVNDLFNNTLGGLVGWLAMPLLAWFLPSRDDIDQSAYEHASANTYTRRFIALMTDLLAVNIFLLFLPDMPYWLRVSIRVGIFTFFPFFFHGNTIGKRLVGIRLSTNGFGIVSRLLRLFLRAFLLHGWILGVAKNPNAFVPDEALLPGTSVPAASLLWTLSFFSLLFLLFDLRYAKKHCGKKLMYERISRIWDVAR